MVLLRVGKDTGLGNGGNLAGNVLNYAGYAIQQTADSRQQTAHEIALRKTDYRLFWRAVGKWIQGNGDLKRRSKPWSGMGLCLDKIESERGRKEVMSFKKGSEVPRDRRARILSQLGREMTVECWISNKDNLKSLL
jgi:hypothetical protein